MGSGSTGCAAVLEGFRFLGIEREAEYVEIAKRRTATVWEDSDAGLFGPQPLAAEEPAPLLQENA